MVRNAKLIRLALLLLGSLILSTTIAAAQSIYRDEGSDGNIVWVSLTGEAGFQECANMNVWNNFNGSYSSGGAGYGEMIEFFESGQAVDGIDYPWSWGFSFEYVGAYGMCNSFSFSSGMWSVGIRVTYWTDRSYVPLGCSWSRTNCSNPPATCSNGFTIGNWWDCPNSIKVTFLYVVMAGVENCSFFGGAIPAGTDNPGQCS